MAGADLLDQYERGEIIMGSDGERYHCTVCTVQHDTADSVLNLSAQRNCSALPLLVEAAAAAEL